MSSLLRTDRMWDLSQPIFRDGSPWAEYVPPNVTHYRRLKGHGGAWTRAVAWEIDQAS
jgi:hypothetical protein